MKCSLVFVEPTRLGQLCSSCGMGRIQPDMYIVHLHAFPFNEKKQTFGLCLSSLSVLELILFLNHFSAVVPVVDDFQLQCQPVPTIASQLLHFPVAVRKVSEKLRACMLVILFLVLLILGGGFCRL